LSCAVEWFGKGIHVSVKPLVRIVTPALAAANSGNWHTARRWRAFLTPVARVDVSLQWNGEPADALIALHARRSAESIRRFRDAHPRRGLALVLTGTDVYRDIARDAASAQSLELASHIVVLQEEALRELSALQRTRARVIVQSAPQRSITHKAARSFDLVAVGHLREEKDPATIMRAVRRLPGDSRIRFLHIGNPLDERLAELARETAAALPHYRWLGGLPHGATRRWIARSRALVHASRIEGGANVVIEAVRSGVPVLASAIPGNIGLLGRTYAGYFPVGDDIALAALMARFATDRDFAQRLAAQAAVRAPGFEPAVERHAVRALVADLLDTATSALTPL
jgi:putative glycosyltransferase (TIGR04348 family)